MSAGATALELPGGGGGGRVLFTSRSEGNLSSVGGREAERGGENRERLRARIGVRALARGYQVHGATVSRVSAAPPSDLPNDRLARADGQTTALAGVGVMVLAADCIPVALGGPSGVAMLHAGWRGIAAGVLEQGVLALRGLGGPDAGTDAGPRAGREASAETAPQAGPALLGAVVGPCAEACCYEVGLEVHEALGTGAGRRGTIDLRAIAERRLLAAGIADVRHVRACTICDERFFSHRREGADAGRQAGVAWLS